MTTYLDERHKALPLPPDSREYLAPVYVEFITGLRELGIEEVTEDFVAMGCNKQAFEWLGFIWMEYQFEPAKYINVIRAWMETLGERK